MVYSLSGLHRQVSTLLRPRLGDDSGREARYLIQAACRVTPEKFITDEKVNTQQIEKALSWAKARLSGMPLSRMTGRREFYGLDFHLNRDTLDPRPDSETLVDQALLSKGETKDPHPLIVDLGTGSGCLLIAILAKWPEARGIGVDYSESALKQARENAVLNKVDGRCLFVRGDWASSIRPGSCSLLISNPPYIPTGDIDSLQAEVRLYDPILALDGGESGLDAYKKIFMQMKQLLTPDGRALFEVGRGQADDVVRLVEETGATLSRIHADSSGIQRVVDITYGDKSFFG